MALRVKIGSAVDDGVSDSDLASVPNIMVRLDIRRTLDDNLIISDHPDIDIVIVPNSGKVVAMAKKLNSGVVYGAQDRLFTFLKDRGVVDPGSIQGGSIYASMEGAIPSAADLPTIKIAVINVAKWMEKEKPAIEFLEDYEDEVVKDYTDPDNEYSTELGQVPQAARKGSILPSLSRSPYGLSLYNYYGY